MTNSLLKNLGDTFLNLVLISFVLGVWNNAYGQNYKFPQNAEPGKCYSKCQPKSNIEFDTIAVKHIVFTGSVNSKNRKYLKKVSLEIIPEHDLWNDAAKKFIHQEAIFVDFFSVKRLNKIDTLDQSETTFKMLRIAGTDPWREIICPSDLTDQFKLDLTKKLQELGYIDESEILPLEMEAIVMAFKQYLHDQDLPVHVFDAETIKSWGLLD